MIIKIQGDMLNMSAVESICRGDDNAMVIKTRNNSYHYKYKTNDDLSYAIERI